MTWVLEVAPAVLGLVVLMILSPRFTFTEFTLVVIAIEMSILIIGGKYSYAEMPLFDWLKDSFDLGRNYYDRLGHFAQGLTPALITREIFIRLNVINGKKWLFWIVLFVTLAISAGYELIEFLAAHLLGEDAESFLGTQGSEWDTQWDMLWAFVGALVALVFFSKWQDRAIAKYESIK